MAYQAIIFLEVIMEKLLLVLICILGIVMMVKGLIARFKYRLKATRCSLQAPRKIIDIKQDEHFTIISVSDHGVGIDKKYQKKIFEQFYRIPATHHKSGYGIGLAMVKYAVKAHGGTIKVVSEPGKGSTFTFTLPLN